MAPSLPQFCQAVVFNADILEDEDLGLDEDVTSKEKLRDEVAALRTGATENGGSPSDVDDDDAVETHGAWAVLKRKLGSEDDLLLALENEVALHEELGEKDAELARVQPSNRVVQRVIVCVQAIGQWVEFKCKEQPCVVTHCACS